MGHLGWLPAGVDRAGTQDGNPLSVECARPAADHRLELAVLEERALQEARQVRVNRKVASEPLDRRVQLRRPEHPGRRGARHQVDDRAEPALEHRLVERLLAGKVIVEARRGEAHLAREVAHRHPVDASGREQALGGVEDGLSRRNRRRRFGP